MKSQVLRIVRGAFSYIVLFFAVASTMAFAQTNVEIEMAGPWSYVQDPNDATKIIVVAPNMGHAMAIFKGENPYGNDPITGSWPKPAPGRHTLDFSPAACGPGFSSDKHLYPVTNVTSATIAHAVNSTSLYSLSLPKPCSYEPRGNSRLKLNASKRVTSSDPEEQFTTWMILHYNVKDPSVPAVFDKGTASTFQIPFGSNANSNAEAASVVLFVSPQIDPDGKCDVHSTEVFDSVLTMWNAPHEFRLFPGVEETGANSNQQVGYDYDDCDQGRTDLKAMFVPDKKMFAPDKKRRADMTSPGRADCHAIQVNVNGAVN